MYPHMFGRLIIFLRRETSTKRENQFLDAVQRLPGILELLQVVTCHGVGQIKKIHNRNIHIGTSLNISVHLQYIKSNPKAPTLRQSLFS